MAGHVLFGISGPSRRVMQDIHSPSDEALKQLLWFIKGHSVAKFASTYQNVGNESLTIARSRRSIFAVQHICHFGTSRLSARLKSNSTAGSIAT
jgi:hypothetical protein